ncbi:MAG: sigma-70 family RNA polymerase sigma factor [Solirubrobacteraceae bacterium]|nr:sigma-70 family RNA polymerase sigma factor [Solirubrobacteraceae bacterium]
MNTTLLRPLTTDSALVRAAAGGDTAATADLYRRYWPDLHRACLRVTRCPDDAADAAQDAMLATLRRLPSLDADTVNVPAYLQVAGRRASLDRVAQRNRTQAYDAAEHDLVDLSGDTADCAERADYTKRVNAALRELPARQREALIRQAYYGDDVPAIAEALGLNCNATSQLLHRARRGLAARVSASD